MNDLDEVELYELAANAGPNARAIADRREAAIESFLEGNGFDANIQGIGTALSTDDGRERVVIGKPGENSFTVSSCGDRPVLEIPPEIDSVSLLRAARSEGFEHPSLASFEAFAASSGRS